VSSVPHPSPTQSSMSRAFCRNSRRLPSIFHRIHQLREPRRHHFPNTCQLRLQSSAVHASELRFGQPLHETHPHLLEAGEGGIDLIISLEKSLLVDTGHRSYTRHLCTRICAAEDKARGATAAQWDSNCRGFRYCLSHWTCLLPISPRSRLFLLDGCVENYPLTSNIQHPTSNPFC